MQSEVWEKIRPLDPEAARAAFRSVLPVPHMVVDDFLQPDFARTVAASYPDFEAALPLGKSYRAVHESGKVQVTETPKFPEPVLRLHEALAAPAFLDTLSRITGIQNLLADPELVGGGMHLMRAGARLDVHVDFNMLKDRALYRRLNILVFMNPDWQSEWGGQLEFWDADVRRCVASLEPRFNRCVFFETSETSFHGVRKVTCPQGRSRNSFAGYYYTEEAPSGSAAKHSTVFRARPDEWWRGRVLAPLERQSRRALRGIRRIARLR